MMTTPAITHETIHRNAPGVIDAFNSETLGGADAILERLRPYWEKITSPEGLNFKNHERIYNVSVDWNYDENNNINGLFVCYLSNTSLDAYKIIGMNGCDRLEVAENHTQVYLNDTSVSVLTFLKYTNPIFRLDGFDITPSNENVICNIQHFQSKDKIAAFFDKNRKILPPNLNTRFYPEPAPHPNPESVSTYCYLIGGIALFIGVAYFATKYFSDSTPAKASTTAN